MESDELRELLNSYDDSIYPEGFLAEYTPMECLSDRNGICTLLVQDRSGESFIAKCCDKALWSVVSGGGILNGLEHSGLPKQIASYENDNMTVTVREYIDGVPLSRYAAENRLSQQEAVGICVQLCDILACLHHRERAIIHRDIKPQNVIIRPDGSAALIDFDIARVYRSGGDTDTTFFGTPDYAPPEQYGFSQTDTRTDIYSLGILLRWLLTGSTKEDSRIRIYSPLAKIIGKCTSFAPKDRFSDVSQVKRALLRADPKARGLRSAALILCALLLIGALCCGGVQLYRHMTYTPFTADTIPAYMSDEERVADAVEYMREKYGTNMFDDTEGIASVGDLRAALIELYGLDRDYVYGINMDIPRESDEFFLPWGWDDVQTVHRDVAVYAAVKVHDPSIVADWSSLKDDDGYYPGVRVAVAFAEDCGITEGANQPRDITLGELALILANADRVFDAAEAK
ncbi:MAG: serine/threonine protein kinase [Oscillospiraceae bacterium]|nr:serine/threonine protein kinase [Oscillospiraceae bacterium]